MKDPKMQWSIILLPIIAFAAASPANDKFIKTPLRNDGFTRNSFIEQQLLDLLEDLRGTMLTGSDDVPVLDPLVVDHLDVDESVLPVPGLRVTVEDAVVTKLSTFVVEDLSVGTSSIIPLRYRANFNAYIPDLEVNAALYDLSVPVDGVQIFGRGNAKINIIEPRITGHIVAQPTLGIGSLRIRLTQCNIKFNLKSFEPQINGLLGGDPAVDAFINAFLRHLVPDLVELYEDDITEAVSEIVLETANEILANLNLFGVIGSN